MSVPLAPNTLTRQVPTSGTGWFLVGANGVGYATLAAAATAGTVPFPDKSQVPLVMETLLRSEGALSADGSAFYVQFNQAAAPSDTTAAHLISGGGQTLPLPGQFNNVWIKKTVAGDIVHVTVKY